MGRPTDVVAILQAIEGFPRSHDPEVPSLPRELLEPVEHLRALMDAFDVLGSTDAATPLRELASPPDLAPRFEIGRRLGSGSFGLVYEAFDNERASPIDRLNQARPLEFIQRRTDRPATRAVEVGESLLVEPLARTVLTRQDRSAYRIEHAPPRIKGDVRLVGKQRVTSRVGAD